MQLSLSSKLPHVGTTIFTVMSQLALKHNAINLSQGFPDFACDPELIQLVSQYMEQGNNQYAPMIGVAALRERIAEKYQDLHQATYHPEEEITITVGASEAIFSAIGSVIRSGDEVLIFEPAYDLYRPAIELFGGVVRTIQLQAPDFTIDWEEVKQFITHKTRLIMMNNPNNPSTKTLQKKDLEALSHLVRDTNILIISDEVYEHIVFDDEEFHSFSRFPILKERSFVIASFGKLFHTTGWKTGYCVAPSYLSKEFRKVHQFNVFSVHTPSQYAIADYISKKDTYLALAGFFQQKRDYFIEALQQSSFDLIPSAGSYFVLADYSRISEEKDIDFAKKLTIDHHVASIPISAFYSHDVDNQRIIRFCFAKKQETLDQALDMLLKI